MQKLDDIFEMLPEEANNEGLRSAPKEANDEDFETELWDRHGPIIHFF